MHFVRTVSGRDGPIRCSVTCVTLVESRRVVICLLALAFALSFSMVFPTTQAAAACTVPNQITNGDVADATTVMGNFNALNNCVNSAVSPSGTPSAGSLPVFTGPNTITSGNLSGDCMTSGTLSLTCTKTNGTSFGYFATGTDAAQLTGTVSVNRFGSGINADGSHFLRGDGVWAIPSGTGGSGSGGGGTPSIRGSNIQSSSSGSYAVTWPTGTVAGDVVIIFGEHAWAFNVPTSWIALDNNPGTYANGFVIGKVMTSADIAAGSVTITTGGSYNGILAAVTIDGSTMSGLRSPSPFVRSSSGPAAAGSMPLYSFTPQPTDLILAFVGIRAATNVTFSSGFTSLANVNAANASGALGRFTGTVGVLGFSETATSSAAGSGYYTAVLILR